MNSTSDIARILQGGINHSPTQASLWPLRWTRGALTIDLLDAAGEPAAQLTHLQVRDLIARDWLEWHYPVSVHDGNPPDSAAIASPPLDSLTIRQVVEHIQQNLPPPPPPPPSIKHVPIKLSPGQQELLRDHGIVGLDTPIYIFSSKNRDHVRIAIERQMWAVADIANEQQFAARATKAAKMPVDAPGLFYCSDIECFTVPFVVRSHPTATAVSNVWPGAWHFPFTIQTRGELQQRIPLARAKREWRTFDGVDNATHSTVCLSGNMAFVASWLYATDWQRIQEELCNAESRNA